MQEKTEQTHIFDIKKQAHKNHNPQLLKETNLKLLIYADLATLGEMSEKV